MTTFQKMIALAKKIRKAHPNKAWTDCIKQAGREVKKTTKPASKKAAPKKKVAVAKKQIGDNHQYFRTQIKLSDGNIYREGSYSIDINTPLKKHEKLIDGYIVNLNNKTAYKATGKKIGAMSKKISGIGEGVTAKINAELSSIARHEKAAQHAMDLVKQVVTKAEKAAHRKTNAYHKKAVSVHKANMRNLKKLL